MFTRELTSDDLGLLLSVFAVLLIAFGIDFRISRMAAQRHHLRSLIFALVNLTGELSTAVALVLTWIALWSPAAWEYIDDLLVFIPGSLAAFCAVVLTVDTVVVRVAGLWRSAVQESYGAAAVSRDRQRVTGDAPAPGRRPGGG